MFWIFEVYFRYISKKLKHGFILKTHGNSMAQPWANDFNRSVLCYLDSVPEARSTRSTTPEGGTRCVPAKRCQVDWMLMTECWWLEFENWSPRIPGTWPLLVVMVCFWVPSETCFCRPENQGLSLLACPNIRTCPLMFGPKSKKYVRCKTYHMRRHVQVYKLVTLEIFENKQVQVLMRRRPYGSRGRANSIGSNISIPTVANVVK